ncbi:uncharacterized protein rbm33b [Brachyhypopomus gauderio]|uniref:uncharacterized protein rbm33b n=1 Tax=Brachyhypopomus gauderio TaxID=698409 RepID=UPI00404184C2
MYSDIEDDILEDDSLIAQNDTGDDELNDDLLRSDEEEFTAGGHKGNISCGAGERSRMCGLVPTETTLAPGEHVLAHGGTWSRVEDDEDEGGGPHRPTTPRPCAGDETSPEEPDPGEVLDIQIDEDEFQEQPGGRRDEFSTQEDWIEEHLRPGEKVLEYSHQVRTEYHQSSGGSPHTHLYSESVLRGRGLETSPESIP